MASAPPGKTTPKMDPSGHSAELRISSNTAETRRIQEALENLLKANHYTEHEMFSIKLAVEEALINAIKHGNQMDQRKNVLVTYFVLPDRFDIHISDEGTGFDPNEIPDPTLPENLERPCGRGLMLMKHYMCEVAYNDRGNCVRMRKYRRNGK